MKGAHCYDDKNNADDHINAYCGAMRLARVL